jgi:hypothetical protein
MRVPSSITVVRPRRSESRIAFAYSTKDRVDLTRRTIAPVARETGCDLFWLDGSATEAGRRLPADLAPELDNLREVHHGVIGGPDAAIVYGMTRLLAEDYDYVGLIENDVLLQDGWLQGVLGLFEAGRRDGLQVGAASGRTFEKRVFFQRGDYAVMLTLGAGMVLFSRPAARAVLATYRTATLDEVRRTCRDLSDLDVAGLWEISTRTEPARFWASADWYYDAALMQRGYASLACTPSLAVHIDADMRSVIGTQEALGPVEARADERHFAIYRDRLAANAEREGDASPSVTGTFHHDAARGGYVVFPHQISTALPSARSGDWRMKWRQRFGPFAYWAESAGAQVTLPIEGRGCDLILGTGPGGGAVEISANGRSRQLDLHARRPGSLLLKCQTDSRQRTDVAIRVLSPGVMWYGIQVAELQPWFPNATRFDFSTLPDPSTSG